MIGYVVTGTFVDSAVRLEKNERAAIWKTLDRLTVDPPPKGLNVEKLKGGKELLSCRVSKAYRIIYQKSKEALILLFVGSHDDAYRFAERAEPTLAASLVVGALSACAITLIGSFSACAIPKGITAFDKVQGEVKRGKAIPSHDVALFVEETANRMQK
jgi:mRNA-degrading endonuclease RelE of RelBE toxin-antitoxin system